MLEKSCLAGNHALIVITRHTIEPGVECVARWCVDCGSTVVDREYDGRVDAGFYARLRSPAITKEANK